MKYIFLFIIFYFNTVTIIYSNSTGKMILSDSTDISTIDYDGPFILYRNNSAIIKQILNNENGFYSIYDSVAGSIKGKMITCKISDTLSFSTKIKDTLIIEPSQYEMPDKIIVLSDIEGNFIPLRDFLINNKVIDLSNKWIFGTGHLILNGDMFDRGLNVTECLWFVYHLEQEALKYGGYVHFILGNHEIMNMNDDLRYVRNKYFENCKLIDEDYKNLYKQNTELGRWLETKNIMEKIGPYFFLHGGISPELDSLNLTIVEINSTAREYYFKNKEAKKSRDPIVNTIFNGKTSPYWYRGYVNGTTTEDELKTTLDNFNVSRIVVGHTIVDSAKYFYNKRIIAVDTDHAEGISEGVLIESGLEYRVDKNGNRHLMK